MPRLTDALLRSLKPQAKRYELPDNVVTGLRICVQPSGVTSWLLRYRVGRRQCKWTMARYPALESADARDLAREAHMKIARGGDPAAEKRGRRLGDDNVATVVEAFIARECRALKNNELPTLLRRDVVGAWGRRSMRDVRRPDALMLIDRSLDQGMPVRANKLLAAMRRLWRWAIARGYAEVNPVEAIDPPHREVARDRVLTDDELAAVWRAAELAGFPFGHIVRLLILTGQRRSEVAGMRWPELDLERRPLDTAERAPEGRGAAHVVPLSRAAVELLNTLPRFTGEFVFPAEGRPGLHATGFNKRKRKLDELSGVPTGRCTISAAPPPPACSGSGPARGHRAFGHTSGSRSGIVAVYQLHRYQDEMREALEQWARHVRSLIATETAGERGCAACLRSL